MVRMVSILVIVEMGLVVYLPGIHIKIAIDVSILVIVEMGLVVVHSLLITILLISFNPCYSGNGFGSSNGFVLGYSLDGGFNPCYSGNGFGSIELEN